MNTKRTTRHAFSLLELTLVLVILGLLAGVAAVNFAGTAERAKIRQTKATMNQYKKILREYMGTHNGAAPASLQDLVTEKYIEPTNAGLPPLDGWKQAFYYQASSTNLERPFELISAGGDKNFDTADDINLWSPDFDAD